MTNILFIGDSESCDLGLGESIIRNYAEYFTDTGPVIKVMAYSNAQPQDFTIGNRVARWGNYQKYSDGKLPPFSEGYISDNQIYPHIDSLMKMRDGVADIVFIQLGTNCLPISSSSRVEQFENLCLAIEKINPDVSIHWITPPNNQLYTPAQSDKLDAEILKIVGYQMMIVTRAIVGMRPGDGEGWPDRDKEHFKICPHAWLEAVMSRIKSLA